MLEWLRNKDRTESSDAAFAPACEDLLITGQNGLVAGTHVASNLGWRAVDQLNVGDKVLTFDNGMRLVTDIQRETLWSAQQGRMPQTAMPVFVPHGALSNRCDLWLMPGQGLLVESDAVHDALGHPFAVLPAETLLGFKGIRRQAPETQLDMIVLSFAQDEVVYVEGGLLAYCPKPRDILFEHGPSTADLYDVLDVQRSKALVERLVRQEAAGAFVYDPEEVVSVA